MSTEEEWLSRKRPKLSSADVISKSVEVSTGVYHSYISAKVYEGSQCGPEDHATSSTLFYTERLTNIKWIRDILPSTYPLVLMNLMCEYAREITLTALRNTAQAHTRQTVSARTTLVHHAIWKYPDRSVLSTSKKSVDAVLLNIEDDDLKQDIKLYTKKEEVVQDKRLRELTNSVRRADTHNSLRGSECKPYWNIIKHWPYSLIVSSEHPSELSSLFYTFKVAVDMEELILKTVADNATPNAGTVYSCAFHFLMNTRRSIGHLLFIIYDAFDKRRIRRVTTPIKIPHDWEPLELSAWGIGDESTPMTFQQYELLRKIVTTIPIEQLNIRDKIHPSDFSF